MDLVSYSARTEGLGKYDSHHFFFFFFFFFFPSENLPICRLKYPYSCFSFYFCLSEIFNLFLMFSVVVLVAFCSISLLVSIFSWNSRIDQSSQNSTLTSPLILSILHIYSLSMSTLRCKALCIVINFLVVLLFGLSSSLVHFKNPPEYLTRGTTQRFIPLMGFVLLTGF